MTARSLLREAVAGAAPGGPNVIVQIDHWAILPATMTIEQTAVELGYSSAATVKRLVKAGKLRRIEDVPGFLVSTSSVRKLVEG